MPSLRTVKSPQFDLRVMFTFLHICRILTAGGNLSDEKETDLAWSDSSDVLNRSSLGLLLDEQDPLEVRGSSKGTTTLPLLLRRSVRMSDDGGGGKPLVYLWC